MYLFAFGLRGVYRIHTMATAAETNLDSVVGKLVVEQGLASPEDIQEVLSKSQKKGTAAEDPSQQSLSDMLVANGIVTERQIERLMPRIEKYHSPAQQIPGFKIIHRLGAGAMATVYLARQLSLDRLVAVKILPRKYMENAQFIERFYAEGRAAAKLNHPNIVGALDVGQAGKYHYFVMEYVKGRTVYDDITDNKSPCSEEEALDIIVQVARALDHAHSAGFIHRDVKPKNIMITSSLVVKLADMGLARAVSDREAAEAEKGKAYGTPYYISPEQIRGEIDVDFRADIYSLGCTLYHMVTGHVPFEGPNPSAVMHKHLKARLTPADRLNPALSLGLCEIIEVCMARDRDKRYQNTTDLLSDLEAVKNGEPPAQARKKFDLASLASLEDTAAIDVSQMQAVAAADAAPKTFIEQPLFWVAMIGWAVALVLGVVTLINATR